LRHGRAELKLFKKLRKNQEIHSESIITYRLASYRAAAKILGLSDRH
jgi:hypothetical protein